MAAQQQQIDRIDFSGVRQKGIDFLLKNNPNITQSQFNEQLKTIEGSITKRQRQSLARQGLITMEDLSKTDPGGALKLLYEGIKPAAVAGVDKPIAAATAKLRGSTKSALTSLNRVQPKIEKGGIKTELQLFGARTGNIPFVGGDLTPFGRSIEADLKNIADVILRFRTGAQANDSEIRTFVSAFGPGVTDPPSVRKQKLETLRVELEEVANSIGLNSATTGAGAGTKSGRFTIEQVE